MALTIEQHLALRAFEAGFHAGADQTGARRRHKVDPSVHEHWRRGLEVGQKSAEMASAIYTRQLQSGDVDS